MNAIDIVFLGLLVLVLIPVVTTDMRERRIPNFLNLIIAGLGFAHAMIGTPTWMQAGLEVMTAVLAALAFAATAWAVGRIDRKAHIGWGDLKFLTAASLWVGIDGSVAVLFVASVASLLTALATAPWNRASWRQPRPFGPMLAIGMIAVVAVTFTIADRA
jgi:leader peptidase (prepilin peptidase)/N-methyltransferase